MQTNKLPLHTYKIYPKFIIVHGIYIVDRIRYDLSCLQFCCTEKPLVIMIIMIRLFILIIMKLMITVLHTATVIYLITHYQQQCNISITIQLENFEGSNFRGFQGIVLDFLSKSRIDSQFAIIIPQLVAISMHVHMIASVKQPVQPIVKCPVAG